MSIENRKHARTDVDLPVRISFGGRSYPASLNNISLGGCMLKAEVKIPSDEVVSLSLDSGQHLGEFRAKVVWQTAGDAAGRMGVCFWEMDDRKKEFLMETVLFLSSQQGAAGG